MSVRIDLQTFNVIRTAYINDRKFNQTALSKQCHIARKTTRKYIKECKMIESVSPKQLVDPFFRMPLPKRNRQVTDRYADLISLLPSLIAAASVKRIGSPYLWQQYRKLRPDGYSFYWFEYHFLRWRRKNNSCPYTSCAVKSVSEEDRKILRSWKNSFDHRKWERALCILASEKGKPAREIADQLERSLKCVLNWMKNYNYKGIDGLIDAPYTVNAERLNKVKVRQDRLIALVHQSPNIYDINRRSWRRSDLATVYEKLHGERIGISTTGTLLKKAGYGFTKSRELLTSPDPNFREKLNKIKSVLANLLPDERFFSVDEFGHFSVKIKGGWSFTKNGAHRIVPQLQKSKGFLIITAALELSTNQVTHFYSRKKDTDEMLKLLDILLGQYQSCYKIYISWDKAAWHVSKKLMRRVEELNSPEYRKTHAIPLIELAPLPASAQFLNVIESVFSGLAKAIIHNSDYESIEACQAAIDRYFKERNNYFEAHPKRAGNKIWGKELVKPVFDETNNCRKRVFKVEKRY